MVSEGDKLGPYRIVGPLGSGAMGDVFRAEDARLGREVAVKVLPQSLAADPERLRRFKQEARAASALSHPNIVTIHDVGIDSKPPYLVSELLEGESLRVRLDRGILPLSDAIDIAGQLAKGLARAHGRGIIHRDLKPENIFITRDNVVKILDFGLAKLRDDEPSETESSESPTRHGGTRPGSLLGTAGYMAPEQVRTEPADHRSDIFSLGCVIYEMLAGARAFQQDTAVETMTSILNDFPPRLGPEIPLVLRQLTEHSLEKDPDERFQSTQDLVFALEVAKTEFEGDDDWEPEPSEVQSKVPLSRMVLAMAIMGVAVAGALLAGRWLERAERARSKEPIHVRTNAPAEQELTTVSAPAISPNGSHVAFLARQPDGTPELWVRDFGESDPVKLDAGTIRSGPYPFVFWSSDGQEIAWVDMRRGLVAIPVRGGAVRTICDAPSVLTEGFPLGGTWSSTGTIVFSYAGLWRVDANSTGPALAASVELPPETSDSAFPLSPQLLPDGKTLLYARGGLGDTTEIWAMDLDEPSSAARLLENAAMPRFVEPSWIYFVREGSLLRQRLDQRGRKVEGIAFTVVEAVRFQQSLGYARADVSPSGDLVYETPTPTDRLIQTDRSGRELSRVGDPTIVEEMALSPNGERLVASLSEPKTGRAHLWLFNLSRGVETRFTRAEVFDSNPIFSPDGRLVAFSSNRRSPPVTAVKPVDGSGEERLLTAIGRFSMPEAWHPDGSTLLVQAEGGVAAIPVEGLTTDEQATLVIPRSLRPSSAGFSPDGSWLAFTGGETQTLEVYASPVRYQGTKIQPVNETQIRLSNSGGREPQWRADGNELLYLSGDRTIMSVAIPGGDPTRAERPRTLFQHPNAIRAFRIAPGGQSLWLASRLPESSTVRIEAVLHRPPS